MFYFTETNTGSQIALESKEVKIMWQEGTGTIIFGTKANRVYSSTEGIATIYARNAPQDMILVTDTISSKLCAIPLCAIKDVRPALTGGGSVVYYGGTKVKQQGVNETVVAIINALAASVAGPTVNAFARHPDATNPLFPALYHTIRIGLNNGSFFPLDLAPILGSTENTMYVSKNGDDALALSAGGYNQHQPWKNPTVAMASAVSGDTVVVMPGVYTIGDVGGEDISDDGLQYLVRNEVVLYMLPGAEIQYTNLTAADGLTSLPFTDAGVASRFIIRGKGKFKFNRNITGGDTFLCTTNAGTTLDWEFDQIDIRRRLETTGHNAALWRMVGREYINRESQLFALRYPSTAGRDIYIKFEETNILAENANNTWTRSEIRNFGSGSTAYVNLGRVTYPHGFNLGALFQKTNCPVDCTIDFYADGVNRTSNNSVRDYLIVGAADLSGGIVDIKNINTPNGLCLYTGAGGLATVKKTETYQGRIRPGYTGIALNLQTYTAMNTHIKSNLDIIMDSLAATYFGVQMLSSPNVAISGKVVWHNTTNEPIRMSSGGTGFGRLENLILSEIDPAVSSVLNLDAAPRNIKVMNVFATTDVSPLNGGVNQLIETIKVDGNI